MRCLTTGVQSFPGQFSNENPFIGGQGTTISDITRELQNLDAESKTVVITDPYLFPRNHKPQYRSELVGLLCGIKAANCTRQRFTITCGSSNTRLSLRRPLSHNMHSMLDFKMIYLRQSIS